MAFLCEGLEVIKGLWGVRGAWVLGVSGLRHLRCCKSFLRLPTTVSEGLHDCFFRVPNQGSMKVPEGLSMGSFKVQR